MKPLAATVTLAGMTMTLTVTGTCARGHTVLKPKDNFILCVELVQACKQINSTAQGGWVGGLGHSSNF